MYRSRSWMLHPTLHFLGSGWVLLYREEGCGSQDLCQLSGPQCLQINTSHTPNASQLLQKWQKIPPWAQYTQNSLTQSSIRSTPFQYMLGYQLPLFPLSSEPPDVLDVDDWYQRSKNIWQSANVRLQSSYSSQASWCGSKLGTSASVYYAVNSAQD